MTFREHFETFQSELDEFKKLVQCQGTTTFKDLYREDVDFLFCSICNTYFCREHIDDTNNLYSLTRTRRNYKFSDFATSQLVEIQESHDKHPHLQNWANSILQFKEDVMFAETFKC
jgi:hypothetical protein